MIQWNFEKNDQIDVIWTVLRKYNFSKTYDRYFCKCQKNSCSFREQMISDRNHDCLSFCNMLTRQTQALGQKSAQQLPRCQTYNFFFKFIIFSSTLRTSHLCRLAVQRDRHLGGGHFCVRTLHECLINFECF